VDWNPGSRISATGSGHHKHCAGEHRHNLHTREVLRTSVMAGLEHRKFLRKFGPFQNDLLVQVMRHRLREKVRPYLDQMVGTIASHTPMRTSL
jgi:hypothetical protein